MDFVVYILRTNANTLYTGQTNNLQRRLAEHRTRKAKSARYLRYFDNFELVYLEEFDTRAEAMARETQLKKWTKTRKEKLVEKFQARK